MQGLSPQASQSLSPAQVAAAMGNPAMQMQAMQGGVPMQGMPMQGMPMQGMPMQMPMQGPPGTIPLNQGMGGQLPMGQHPQMAMNPGQMPLNAAQMPMSMNTGLPSGMPSSSNTPPQSNSSIPMGMPAGSMAGMAGMNSFESNLAGSLGLLSQGGGGMGGVPSGADIQAANLAAAVNLSTNPTGTLTDLSAQHALLQSLQSGLLPSQLDPGQASDLAAALQGRLNTNNADGSINADGSNADGAGSEKPAARNVSFSPTELSFYQTLYNMVETEDSLGEIDGREGADFLAKSGLSRNTLHEIWTFADNAQTGRLKLEDFYVALRLIGHAQAGTQINADLVHTEPPVLPSFDGLSRKRTPSDISGNNTPRDENTVLKVMGAKIDSVPGGEVPSSQFISSKPDFRVSDREDEYYTEIYLRLQPNSDGQILGSEITDFLKESGLHLTMLHEIWGEVDESGSGLLSKQQFFMVLRLIAHAQKGREIAGGRIYEEPAELANFGSELPQKNCPTPSNEPFWVEPLTLNDRKKYASIFLKSDHDEDGYVDGDDAKVLMQRSQLGSDHLAIIWNIADRDADGRLNFREFIAVMHLITRSKKGDFDINVLMQIPDVENTLPPQFEHIFNMELESANSLASVVPSPRDSASEEIFKRGWDRKNNCLEGSDPAENPTEDTEKEDTSTTRLPQFGAADSSSATKKPNASAADGGLQDTSYTAQHKNNPITTLVSTREAGNNNQSSTQMVSPTKRKTNAENNASRLSRALESLIEADKKLSSQAKREVDVLEENVKTLNDYFEKLQRDVEKDARGIEKLQKQKRDMQKQLGFQSERLATLTRARREQMVAVITKGTRNSTEEQIYLEDLIADARDTVATLHDANTSLEKQYQRAESHINGLERHKRDVHVEVTAEKESLKQDERSNAQLKTNIEALQRKLQLGEFNQSKADYISAIQDASAAGGSSAAGGRSQSFNTSYNLPQSMTSLKGVPSSNAVRPATSAGLTRGGSGGTSPSSVYSRMRASPDRTKGPSEQIKAPHSWMGFVGNNAAANTTSSSSGGMPNSSVAGGSRGVPSAGENSGPRTVKYTSSDREGV